MRVLFKDIDKAMTINFGASRLCTMQGNEVHRIEDVRVCVCICVCLFLTAVAAYRFREACAMSLAITNASSM